MSRTFIALGLLFDTVTGLASASQTDHPGVIGAAFLAVLSCLPQVYGLAQRWSDRLLNPPAGGAETLA